MKSFLVITEALREHGSKVKVNGTGKAQAQCPAHDDRNPSLSITYKPDPKPSEAKVLLSCFAACDYKQILHIIGLTESDLFDEPREPNNIVTDLDAYRFHIRGIEQPAAIEQHPAAQPTTTEWVYHNAAGEPAYKTIKTEIGRAHV